MSLRKDETKQSPAGETPQRFSLWYLLRVTALLAVGLRLAFDEFLIARTLGVGICLYWSAKAIFAISGRLPRGVREALFLCGLPLYLGAIYFSCWFVGLALGAGLEYFVPLVMKFEHR